jgi:antitoxin component HigA of HigAB toxin-antitoxin module
MEIKPIRTESDYEAALAEVERLWGAGEPGTPDGDRFEVLFSLVEAYKDLHRPILPADPLVTISDWVLLTPPTHPLIPGKSCSDRLRGLSLTQSPGW